MYRYPTKVRELSWHHTSRFLATGRSETATIWNCAGKGPAGTRPIELKDHETFIRALAFQHRGDLIATAASDGTLVFWQVDKPKRPLVQTSLGSSISQLHWSPDDRLVAIGTETGMVTVCSPPQTRYQHTQSDYDVDPFFLAHFSA